MQLNVQTDSEILISLIKKFNSTDDKAEKTRILKDFEFYVHQVKFSKSKIKFYKNLNTKICKLQSSIMVSCFVIWVDLKC